MLKLLTRMRPQEWCLVGVCAVLLLSQVYFDLKLPDYITDLTVLIQSNSEPGPVWRTGLDMLGCVLASACLCVAAAYCSARIAAGFTYGLRDDLFKKVTTLGQSEIVSLSVPSLITRTTNDVTQIQMIIGMGLQALVKSPVMAVWAIAKILDKSWELSALTACFVVAICVFLIVIVSIIVPRFRIIQRLTDSLNLITRENLEGISVVHAFNAQQYQNDKFQNVNNNMYGIQLKNQRLFALMQPFMGFAMNSLTLGIFWLGAVLLAGIPAEAAADRLTMFSNIVVFSTYATYVVMSFMMLVMIFMIIPAAQVSAERINEVLHKEPSIKEGTLMHADTTGVLEFDDVSFCYPDAQENDLNHISFTVNTGETLAIIGATGSGKTTLIHLITRFYDATQGTVLVDGQPIQDYAFDALYAKFGYATQKAVLFTGTILENVAFGEQSLEDKADAVMNALHIAQASDFVSEADGELQHHIARGGKNVSGGQKQRLSVARALAKHPEFLIFDDTFSALDYKTDAALRTELDTQLAHVTKVIVAQRISTVRNADHILVLDNGSMAGYGTHDELLQDCAVYKEIALSQLSEKELKEMGVQE